MAKLLQAIRGMNDLQPKETSVWRYVESTIRHTLDQYGFQEIRTPVIEPTQLFQRSVGEHTDIVEKEMYTFNDRNDESLTLRPEFTAGIVRAGIEHGLFYNQIRRLWTMGQLFRYERPQKGRYRQFYQLSVEIFGITGVEADVELILLSARLWKVFGIADKLTLQINSLGTNEERKAYREALVAYCSQHKEALDKDSLRRLNKNPLRILDSKDETTRKLLEDAPPLEQFLGDESQKYFNQICTFLSENGISYVINHQLVRGLDYYSKTVFEWTTDALGAQGTICGGGRYDRLAEMLGGKPTPACGFGLGMERLILLILETSGVPSKINRVADIAIVAENSVSLYAIKLAEKIRDMAPEVKLLTSVTGSLKSQMKKADHSGAEIAFIAGQLEADQQQITVKYLRRDQPQQTCTPEQAVILARETLANR